MPARPATSASPICSNERSASKAMKASIAFSRPAAGGSGGSPAVFGVSAMAISCLKELLPLDLGSASPGSKARVLSRELAGAAGGGGNRVGQKAVEAGGTHQHLQRGGGGAARRGHILAQGR